MTLHALIFSFITGVDYDLMNTTYILLVLPLFRFCKENRKKNGDNNVSNFVKYLKHTLTINACQVEMLSSLSATPLLELFIPNNKLINGHTSCENIII